MKDIVFRHLKTLALVVTVFALSACAGISTQGYSGPALPADQTAMVNSGAYTDLIASDGVKISGMRVAVLPGRHTIVMKPSDNQDAWGYGAYFFYSRVTGSVEFTAEAGHTYLAYVNIGPAPETTEESGMGYAGSGSTDTGFTWIGYITDKTTGKKIARTDRLALQAEPRGYPTGVAVLFR